MAAATTAAAAAAAAATVMRHTHTHGVSNGVWRRQTPLGGAATAAADLYTRLYTVYEAPLAVISIRMSAYTKVRLYECPLHRDRDKEGGKKSRVTEIKKERKEVE